MLAVFRCYFNAKLNVRAFVLVRQHFADVVQQRTALCHRYVEPELRSHDASEEGNFLRVVQNVLTVTRSPLHPTDQLDQLWMKSGDTGLVRGLLAGFDDTGVD